MLILLCLFLMFIRTMSLVQEFQPFFLHLVYTLY